MLLRNKLDVTLSNQVNNSHIHNAPQYSSNIKYKEEDNNKFTFHQQDQMETVINTTPDICDQNKVTVDPQIEKNKHAKIVNQERSKGTVTKSQKMKNQHTGRDKIVIILDNSMIKHVNGWEMAEKVKKCNIYVKKFLWSEGTMSKGPCETIT